MFDPLSFDLGLDAALRMHPEFEWTIEKASGARIARARRTFAFGGYDWMLEFYQHNSYRLIDLLRVPEGDLAACTDAFQSIVTTLEAKTGTNGCVPQGRADDPTITAGHSSTARRFVIEQPAHPDLPAFIPPTTLLQIEFKAGDATVLATVAHGLTPMMRVATSRS